MTPPHTRQLHSTVHKDSTVTLALVDADLPAPGPDDVVVRIEAAPINPSDLGVMFARAEMSTLVRDTRVAAYAVRATLSDVLTDKAFDHMIRLAERFESAVADSIAEHGLPWQVTRLGCRAEYMFAPERPRTGGEAAAEFDPELDALMHLYMLNRGVLMTPFHMMALMSPATTEAEVDRHSEAFAAAADELAV